MLDKIAIFSKGGIVLWSMTFATMHGGNPVDELIRTVLLEVIGLFGGCTLTQLAHRKEVGLIKPLRAERTPWNGRCTTTSN